MISSDRADDEDMKEFGDFAENPGLSVAGATTTDEVLVGEDEDEGFGEFESAGKRRNQ